MMPRHERLMREGGTLALWVGGLWTTFGLWVAALVLPPVPGDPSMVPVFGGALVICACCSLVQYCEFRRIVMKAD